ncbi:39S ribosomal protein L39, mitochondrial [Octopus bimaculoides]|uniref:Large ribosomal subunit protein mL39 n=1 Tax=Octopus bimaculoides TaxID=37653 RepID=A0A0L8HM83_OCTBM|nr:39S ribosomal protein L39, mitochondrial [Octopus bimaculoides]|eukprot:XP_014771263.1 PREDICTED: 39S ribosomal protein L39, mitochondrial-like [Octopus bimaculoides]
MCSMAALCVNRRPLRWLSAWSSFSRYQTYCSQKKNPAEIRKRQNELFDEEKKRQLSFFKRIEKIRVEHVGAPEDCTLIMNKGLSTPFNCAMHIAELLMKRSVVACVNGQIWDMHRPLVEDCQLSFLHFKEDDCQEVNRAFWRSCSFILGYVLMSAFKDDYHVELCRFPSPNVKSGSFVYDADLNLPNWKPTLRELYALSSIGSKLQYQDYRFEPLTVNEQTAREMFQHNRFKLQQIPSIASQSSTGDSINLYRVGDHIDISQGPMISSTAHLCRFSLTAIHNIECPDYGKLQRVQGVAIPNQFWLHQWTYNLLEKQSQKLNWCTYPNVRKKIEAEKSQPEPVQQDTQMLP